MRLLTTFLKVALLWFVLTTQYATAANEVPKFALVIGNQSYQYKQFSLANTNRDAELISSTLRKIGFQVTKLANLDREAFSRAVTEFAETLPAGSTAFVFYAGHGMQVGGSNYLVPVDMQPTSEASVPLKAYPLKTLLDHMARSKSSVNIVVLDACRNNPFQPAAATKYRNLANLGFASLQAPRGTLIAFSTAPGQLAADGKGQNSIYTRSLANNLALPELELEDIFKRTGSEVRRTSYDDQIPWYESSITEQYFFLPPASITVTAGKTLDRKRQTKEPSRNLGSTRPRVDDWYRQLSASEWNDVEREINLRVRQMSQDEIAAIEHKARGGSVIAQTVLGMLYKEGYVTGYAGNDRYPMRSGVDNTKAMRWLNMASDKGFAVAQVELAEMHYGGRGTDRNLDTARNLLEQANQSGYPRAKIALFQINLERNPGQVKPHELIDSIFNMNK